MKEQYRLYFAKFENGIVTLYFSSEVHVYLSRKTLSEIYKSGSHSFEFPFSYSDRLVFNNELFHTPNIHAHEPVFKILNPYSSPLEKFGHLSIDEINGGIAPWLISSDGIHIFPKENLFTVIEKLQRRGVHICYYPEKAESLKNTKMAISNMHSHAINKMLVKRDAKLDEANTRILFLEESLKELKLSASEE